MFSPISPFKKMIYVTYYSLWCVRQTHAIIIIVDLLWYFLTTDTKKPTLSYALENTLVQTWWVVYLLCTIKTILLRQPACVSTMLAKFDYASSSSCLLCIVQHHIIQAVLLVNSGQLCFLPLYLLSLPHLAGWCYAGQLASLFCWYSQQRSVIGRVWTVCSYSWCHSSWNVDRRTAWCPNIKMQVITCERVTTAAY